MNVLIIGANGFLGSHLVKECQKQDWTVYGTYHRQQRNMPSHCHTIDINDLWSTNKLFKFIFLTAAAIPYSNRPLKQEKIISTNIELPLLVIRKFPQAKIIFSSSVSVYGTHRETIRETSSFNNPNLYGLSKIAGETIICSQKKFAIVRFSSLIGLGMYPDTFLPHCITEAQQIHKITLFGTGQRKQNYLHVTDAATFCIKAAYHPTNDIFLGVSGSSYSNIEAAKIIQQYLPKTKILFHGKDESPSYIYDNTYTTQLLHFVPKVDLKKAIYGMM